MDKVRNDNLYNFSVKTPWQFVFFVILYTIGAVSIPYSYMADLIEGNLAWENFSLFFVRLIGCILPTWLLFEVKLKRVLRPTGFLKGIIVILPFIIVTVCNFPIVTLITGQSTIVNDGLIWCTYSLACLGGVFLEECAFRGLIFPVLLKHYQAKKYGEVLAVILSSVLFGVVHLANLLAGAGFGAVIMQIGYSTLIGAMCSVAFLKTGNFYHAILLHFIFNLGGLLFDRNMLTGITWSVPAIILMATVSVIAIVYAFLLVFAKKGENKVYNVIDFQYGEEKHSDEI